MVTYARGQYALGLCDRCGQRQRLNDLKFQVVDLRITKLRVCSACLDVDHPQLQLGRVRIIDPQALRDARPDPNTDRSLFGFNPVGNPGNIMTASVGTVRIIT